MNAECEIKTIRELIDRMAVKQPGATFLVSPETGRRVTFLELRERSRRLAARFQQSGWEPGDKIACLMDNGLFTAQLFLGTMYAGLVMVPLNVRAGVSQLSYTLDHSDAKAVFVGDEYQALMKEVMAHVRRSVQVLAAGVDDGVVLESDVAPVPLAAVGLDDVALLMYTSGSTGQPKAAVHTHATVLAGGRNSVCSHELTDVDRSLLVLPLYHINAECVTLVPTLLSGGSVVVPHGFNVSQFWDWLDDYRCTWSALVPTIISQLLDWKDPKAETRQAAFTRIRFLRSSSAPLSPALHREFLAKFKLPLIQAMGSSECGNIFSNPVPPGVNKVGSPGVPWGFETRIVSREGVELPAGEPGEVLIRGAAMMEGYYKDPVGTAAALDVEGWLHTGDLAYRDADGYFFVVGRSKELIIKGGMNIAPKQIDEVLESHPAVLEAAAVGVPDRYVGEDLVAFVVLRNGMTCDERELLTHCEGQLGHFKTPTRVYFVQDLPKGPSGKVQRLRLVEEAVRPAFARSVSLGAEAASANLNVPAAQAGQAPSQSAIEQIIAGIWADLLVQPQIDVRSNFFALGGHSLLAIQSLSRLREKLPVVLSLSDFFENATVAEQAVLLRQRLIGSPALEAVGSGQIKADAQPIPARDRTHPCPLSPAQERIWFFEQLVPEVPLYNESEAVRLTGKLDVDALECALNVIVERHEILRSTIQVANGQPTVLVHESWPLSLKRIDLSAMAEPEREAQIGRLLIEEPRRPYRLQAEPGIRATLLRLSPEEHVFILLMHHLVCDWSSEGVIWRELSASYRAMTRGQSPVLPPLPIQLGDYAAWQVQQLNEGGFAGDLAYWEENLRGAPALLELPADRPRPSVNSYAGARQRFRIGSTLAQVLRDCSRREKISLFTLFTAALDTLLYRYTGQEDILLGIPLADRDRLELQSVIGFLLHTHVLRTRLSGDLCFRDLLARVQKGVLDLYAHRAAPFDQVVSKVHPDRSLSYSPLFQVMINWRDRDQQLSFIGMDGLAVESLLAESRTSKFDLTLMVTDDGDDIWLEMEYNTEIFDNDRIGRMVGHYQTLLEALAADPDKRLAELPLLTDAEHHQLLVEWNDTHVDYPADKCLHELIEEQAARTPEAVAVVFEDRSLTYRQLNERANQLARHLQKLGIGPDKLVGICVERSLEMVIGLLGILKAGGAYVPLDPEYPRKRLGFVLADSMARFLVTQTHLAERFPANKANAVLVDEVSVDIPVQNLPVLASSNNLAYVIYTSGSTGKPKGVEIEHRALVNFLTSMRDQPGLAAQDTLLAITTLSFDIAGLELWLPLISGARVVVASRQAAQDGAELADLLIRSRATVMQATPTTWQLLLFAGWQGSPELKILCGGEAWTSALADRLAAKCGSLWNMYGPTETTVWSAVSELKARETVLIGPPISNTQFYVLDRQLQPCPIGVPGELWIGGKGLARGYCNRPELTEDRFRANSLTGQPSARIYRTGDLVRWRGDRKIEFLGRLDHQIKIRGFRVELGEIESVLSHHPGVQTCVVVAREDTPGDKRLVAYFVGRDGGVPLAELRELLRAKLPEYMMPAAFVPLDKLPLSPNGKVERKALPQPDVEPESDKYVAPITPTQVALAEIWCQVLGLRQIGIHDNFFDRGMHSLLATRLITVVNKHFCRSIRLGALFSQPTIFQLSSLLDNQVSPVVSGRLEVFRGKGTNAPLFYIPGMFGYEFLPRGLERRLGERCRFYDGLHYPGLNDQQPVPTRIEDIASHLVTQIRAVWPDGPYYLCGWSFGGVMAYEVARQLEMLEARVEVVFLLDTRRPGLTLKKRTTAEIIAFLRKRLSPLNLRQRLFYLRDMVATRVRFMWSRRRWPFPKRQISDPGAGTENTAMKDAVRQAVGRYQPGNYGGKVVLFQIEDWEKLYSCTRYALDPAFGWSELVCGLEIISVPGDHLSIVNEPAVSRIAGLIAEQLLTDESRRTHAPSRRIVQSPGEGVYARTRD